MSEVAFVLVAVPEQLAPRASVHGGLGSHHLRLVSRLPIREQRIADVRPSMSALGLAVLGGCVVGARSAARRWLHVPPSGRATSALLLERQAEGGERKSSRSSAGPGEGASGSALQRPGRGVSSGTSGGERASWSRRGSSPGRSGGEGTSESPLQRCMKRPNFPQALPIDPFLTGSGGCLHLPALGCRSDDFELVHNLVKDVQESSALGVHRSKKHMQAWGDQLKDSPTFTAIVARMMSAFGLTLVDCWVNVYRNGSESKAWHHDNYQDRRPRPTVTIGLSLGDTRDIAFEYAPDQRPSGKIFRVPQKNGDVFAFDERFNKQFRHSIPEASRDGDRGLRASVIIWAMEGKGLATPKALRSFPGNMPSHDLCWHDWDLEAGLRSDSLAFADASEIYGADSKDVGSGGLSPLG